MDGSTRRLFYFLALLIVTACATVPITGRTQLMLIVTTKLGAHQPWPSRT